MQTAMQIHANLYAGWHAMPRYMKAGEGAEVIMSLMEKSDETLFSRKDFDSIVGSLPQNMGASYYLKEALKLSDAEDASELEKLIAFLGDD